MLKVIFKEESVFSIDSYANDILNYNFNSEDFVFGDIKRKGKIYAIAYEISSINTEFQNSIENHRDFFDRDNNLVNQDDYRNLFKKVLCAEPNVLYEYINSDNFTDLYLNMQAVEIYQKLFIWSGGVTNRIKNWYDDHIELESCYFCNRNFINELENGSRTYSLDHFYYKAKSPIITYSFYNLVPVCMTCNTMLKNQSEVKCKSPYDESFKLHKIKFWIIDHDSFKPRLEHEEYSDLIQALKINEQYATHNDYVKKLCNLRDKYPDTRIEEMASIMSVNDENLKKDIFGVILDPEHFHMRPLAKLHHDILTLTEEN